MTAIDTATELIAYYPVQVEKMLDTWERLAALRGEEKLRSGFAPDELRILNTFLEHGRAVRAERERARGPASSRTSPRGSSVGAESRSPTARGWWTRPRTASTTRK